MPITKRCIRCRKPLREDGTCQNPDCVRYVPESEPEPEEVVAENATTTEAPESEEQNDD